MAAASNNVDNSVDFNVINDDSRSDWLNLQNDYNLDDNSTYANDEPAVSVSCMNFTGKNMSDKISDEEGGQAPVMPEYHLISLAIIMGEHDDLISNTLLVHHSLLKYSMRSKGNDVDKAISYNTIRCKLRQIGIHNIIGYFCEQNNRAINLCVNNANLPVIAPSTFVMIDNKII